MPDHHTYVYLLGHPVAVTVSWLLASRDEGDMIEIEGVFSDVLGDITHLVLNSVVNTGVTLGRVPDRGWQDPVRTALFGQPTYYRHGDPRLRPCSQPWSPDHPVHAIPVSVVHGVGHLVVQHEPTRPQFGFDGTLYQALDLEIAATQAYDDAMAGSDDVECWDWLD